MSRNQNSPNANELWAYFHAVINWVKMTFVNYRKEMKGLDWGSLYNKYKNIVVDTAKLEQEIAKLMADVDVSNKKGIYTYVLTRDEKFLNIRAFDDRMKREAYEAQFGHCIKCCKYFPFEEVEADHVIPWSQGGKTIATNCQILCRECNRRKSDK